MRAVQITEFGGLDVLQVADVERPEPGPDEVLIRVSRAGINFADTHQRENSYLARFELPLIPGGEVAGVVERGAGDLAEGTRVVAMLRDVGYDVTYEEFDGGHTVPPPVAEHAFRWWLEGPVQDG